MRTDIKSFLQTAEAEAGAEAEAEVEVEACGFPCQRLE